MRSCPVVTFKSTTLIVEKLPFFLFMDTVDAQPAHVLLQLCIMKSSISLIIIFFTGLWNVYGASHFRICAFNLHNFGESKAKKSSVMDTLSQVRPAAWPSDVIYWIFTSTVKKS